MRKLILTFALLCFSLPAQAQDKPSVILMEMDNLGLGEVGPNDKDDFITKPQGELTIDFGQTIKVDEKGLPTKDSFQTIYDEMDYQGAVSAYLQSIPQMALYGSNLTNDYYGATGDTDSLLMYQDPSVDGMLTPNRRVKYLFNYPNLANSGPMVYEFPGGTSAGIILDMQMRFLADLGLTGPYTNKPVKYLVLTEDQAVPKDINLEKQEYVIVRSKTNQIFFAFRVLNPQQDPNLAEQTKIYPYSERMNPQPNKFFQAKKDDKTYYMAQPTGMKYWQQLHQYIQEERVPEADRFMMGRLKAVGIEKGKPFNPTARQQRILEKAALVGEKMALTTTFASRTQGTTYRDDTTWVHPLTLNPSHRFEESYQIEERVDWTTEAYGISTAMKAGIPGEGSTYLAAYRDSENEWFEGEHTYRMKVAADVPAARFWDLSVYRLDTRGLLPLRDDYVSAINSTTTQDIKVEDDGSIYIYFGPGEAPEGYENNFINTYEGVRWFTYFRLYGPTDTYFDRSWKMYDIERID